MNLARVRVQLPAANATAVGVVRRDGGVFHLFSDGGLLPVVRGGAPDDDEDPDKDKNKADEKKFSQPEVDRIAARRADEGERAGKKALLEQLGLPADTKPEDLKARLDAIQQAEDAKKDEATKAKDAADAAKADAEKEKRTAAEARHSADVEKYLLRAGLGRELDEDDKDYDDKLAKAVSRAAKLVDVEVGADGQKIRDAIADLKKDMPALFATGTSGGDRQPDSDAAARTRKAKDSKVSGVARGKEKARQLGWAKEKQTA